MRILAGEAHGRQLLAPPGLSTRPTAARVRGAIMDRQGSALVGAQVLDLFAGTGALGLEALSRGAARAVFVEQAAGAARVLRENLNRLGWSARATVLQLPVQRALRSLHAARFELALLDAPWGAGLLPPALAELHELELMAPEGVVVVVHGWRELPPPAPPGWCAEAARRFGDSGVTTYERHRVEEEQ